MTNPLSRKRDIVFFLLPGLLLYTSIVFFPIFSSIYYSFLEWNFATTKIFVGFDNFVKMFRTTIFIKSIRNSLVVAFAKVCIEIPISLIFALVLAWGVKGEKTFRVIYFLPTILSHGICPDCLEKLYPEFADKEEKLTD